MDCSPPGSSEHGISQAKILEWVAISSSRRSSQPRDRTFLSTSQVLIFYRIKSLTCHIHFKMGGKRHTHFLFCTMACVFVLIYFLLVQFYLWNSIRENVHWLGFFPCLYYCLFRFIILWKIFLLCKKGVLFTAMWWPRGLGWEGGREAQEGGDICTHMADSPCYTAGTNTAQ